MGMILSISKDFKDKSTKKLLIKQMKNHANYAKVSRFILY